MTAPAEPRPPGRTEVQLSPALVEYADRLLLGTGLEVADALRIATRHLDPPAGLRTLSSALCAGWDSSEGPA